MQQKVSEDVRFTDNISLEHIVANITMDQIPGNITMDDLNNKSSYLENRLLKEKYFKIAKCIVLFFMLGGLILGKTFFIPDVSIECLRDPVLKLME